MNRGPGARSTAVAAGLAAAVGFVGLGAATHVLAKSPAAARTDGEAPPAETAPAASPAPAEWPASDPRSENAALGGKERAKAIANLNWQVGPATVPLGANATLRIPAHFKAVAGPDADRFLEETQNMPNPKLLAIVLPSERPAWHLVFAYENCGHVLDTDHEGLNASEMFHSYRQGVEAANPERRRRGWSELRILGWLQPPAYDPASRNLNWAIKGSYGDGREIANYNMRLLGREGVIMVSLVADPDKIPDLIPQVKQLVSGCEFTPGNRYDDFREGDRLAEHGLGSLITSEAPPAGAPRSRNSLWAKLAFLLARWGNVGKAIAIGAVVTAVAIWRYFRRISGAQPEPDNSGSP